LCKSFWKRPVCAVEAQGTLALEGRASAARAASRRKFHPLHAIDRNFGLMQDSAASPFDGGSASASARSRRQRVLLTIDGGGFLWQSLTVAHGLHPHVDLHLASPWPPGDFMGRSIPRVPLHKMTRTTRVGERYGWQKVVRFVQGLRDARRLIKTVRPDFVVCVASSMAIPLFIVARAAGVSTVFVESVTRVTQPSWTGRVLSRLGLCDRLYVQWPQAQSLYPGALYKGSLL
jgi:hypothetical protein